MTFAYFLLALLDLISEVAHLTYQLGERTRRYGVPVLIGAYVLMDMAWENLTEMEMDISECNRP